MKKRASSSKDQHITQILRDLESIRSQYPPELLAARRAAFIDQVAQHTQIENMEEWAPENQPIIEHLMNLRSMQVEYPPKLLNARRSAFKRQLAQRERVRVWVSLRSAVQNGFARLSGTSPAPSVSRMRISLVLAGIAFAAFAGFLLQEGRHETINVPPSPNAISMV